MKNFEKEILNYEPEQNQSPFIYVTKQVSKAIDQISMKLHTDFTFDAAIATLILAPLQTIVTSLQLSVQPHKNIYENITEAKSKQIARLNTQMTIHQKKNFQLMIRSGQKNPYTAPVYSGYIETLKSLAQQGWKSFYKGAGFRTFTTLSHLYCYKFVGDLLNEADVQRSKSVALLKIAFSAILIDVINNPFHILQNRYILQSGISQFKVFRKAWKDTYKLIQMHESVIGWKYHLPNNLIEMLTKLPLYISIMYAPNQNITGLYHLVLIGQSIMYPFQTAYKRVICQSQRYPGMIPLRYKNIFHAVKVMAYEEGARGLWRGFGLHLINVIFKLELLRSFLSANVSIQMKNKS